MSKNILPQFLLLLSPAFYLCDRIKSLYVNPQIVLLLLLLLYLWLKFRLIVLQMQWQSNRNITKWLGTFINHSLLNSKGFHLLLFVLSSYLKLFLFFLRKSESAQQQKFKLSQIWKYFQKGWKPKILNFP